LLKNEGGIEALFGKLWETLALFEKAIVRLEKPIGYFLQGLRMNLANPVYFFSNLTDFFLKIILTDNNRMVGI
jgi:hypothetical protein